MNQDGLSNFAEGPVACLPSPFLYPLTRHEGSPSAAGFPSRPVDDAVKPVNECFSMLQQENGTWWLEHARTLTSNWSGAVFWATQQQNNLPAANLLCSLQRSLNLSQCQWSSRQVLATPLQGRSQRKRSGTGPRTMGHLKWFCRFCSTRVCLCTSRTQIQINALSIMKQNTSNH